MVYHYKNQLGLCRNLLKSLICARAVTARLACFTCIQKSCIWLFLRIKVQLEKMLLLKFKLLYFQFPWSISDEITMDPPPFQIDFSKMPELFWMKESLEFQKTFFFILWLFRFTESFIFEIHFIIKFRSSSSNSKFSLHFYKKCILTFENLGRFFEKNLAIAKKNRWSQVSRTKGRRSLPEFKNGGPRAEPPEKISNS